MKVGAFILFVLLALISLFMVLNWPAIMTPTGLNFGITKMIAPLGLVMLGLLVLLTALFLAYAVYLQTSVLLGARRHAKELHTNRELADRAEASRFTELQKFMATEIQKQAMIEADLRAAIMHRFDTISTELNSTVSQMDNVFAAYIGELEDRIESKLAR